MALGEIARDLPPRDSFEAYEPGEAHYRAAARWLLRLREEDRETSPAFERWREADPANRFAFAEVEALLAASAPAARGVPWTARKHGGRVLRRMGRWAGAAIAACLLLFLAMGQADRVASIGADAATLAGEQRDYTMADGTRIQLNTRSAIDTDTDAEFRGVRLRRGEAFFEVARDEARPFTVRAGDAHIRVLGTKFNVRIDRAGRTVVSVTEGHVEVTSTKDPTRVADLVAGQEAVVAGETVRKRAADLFVVEGWRRGEAVFLRAPLSEAVAELNRYRGNAIWLLNRDLTDDRVTGVFPTRDPRRAVRMIETTLGADAVTLPTGQTVVY